MMKQIIFRGKRFESLAECCHYNQISIRSVYYQMKIHKVSREDALDLVFKYRDHEGRFFKTLREMCEFHHVKYNTASKRLAKGHLIKDVLSRESLRNKKAISPA